MGLYVKVNLSYTTTTSPVATNKENVLQYIAGLPYDVSVFTNLPVGHQVLITHPVPVAQYNSYISNPSAAGGGGVGDVTTLRYFGIIANVDSWVSDPTGIDMSEASIPTVAVPWGFRTDYSTGHLINYDINLPTYEWDYVADATVPAALAIQPLDADKVANAQAPLLTRSQPWAPVTTTYTFNVSRSGSLSTAEAVNYSIVGSGANPATPSDFQNASGRLSFAPGQASQTLTLTLGDHVSVSTFDGPNFGFTVNLSSLDDGTASSTGNIQGVPTPDYATLADIANAARLRSTAKIDGYTSNAALQASDPATNLYGEAFQDGDQVVVAFRGTVPTSLSDLTADLSWFRDGTPNETLLSYLSEAAALVRDTKAYYPHSNITLTGHSLGGAIAELVGYAAGLPAVTFNAPGAAQWKSIPAVLRRLLPAGVVATASNQINFRVNGDQVSLAGTQFGQTRTLGSSNMYTWNSALEDHSMASVLANFQGLSVAGIPDAPLAGLSLIVPLRGADGISSTIETTLIDITHHFVVDPSGASTFDVSADSGSAPFATVTLPFFDNISKYALAFRVGSTKLPSQVVNAGAAINAPAGATGFSYTALDSTGAPTVMQDHGDIELTFASAGTFGGTITPQADTPISAPTTTPTATSSSPTTTPTVTSSSTGNSIPVTQTTIGAVYRFFDSNTGTHFFTSDVNERNAILASRNDLIGEANGFGAVIPGSPNSETIFRFFDTVHGTHFFTASVTEAQTTQATRSDLTYEPNSAFYEHSTQQSGDVAVYRLFDTQYGTHFYTGSQSEYAGITMPGTATYRANLVSEGVAFYAPSGSFT